MIEQVGNDKSHTCHSLEQFDDVKPSAVELRMPVSCADLAYIRDVKMNRLYWACTVAYLAYVRNSHIHILEVCDLATRQVGMDSKVCRLI